MAGPQDLPSDVRDATDRHLAVLDAVAPGLVGGLYLTGSVTLGDYQPGRSDIDFMAFTTGRRTIRTWSRCSRGCTRAWALAFRSFTTATT
jgi:Nucleotidyltransferase domain